MNDVLGIISLVLNFILGGGGLWLWRDQRRLKRAEALREETNTAVIAGNEWKELYEKAETQIIAKDAKIDGLFVTLNEWRDKYNAAIAELHKIKLEKQTAEYRECRRRGCQDREPQTGF